MQFVCGYSVARELGHEIANFATTLNAQSAARNTEASEGVGLRYGGVCDIVLDAETHHSTTRYPVPGSSGSS